MAVHSFLDLLYYHDDTAASRGPRDAILRVRSFQEGGAGVASVTCMDPFHILCCPRGCKGERERETWRVI